MQKTFQPHREANEKVKKYVLMKKPFNPMGKLRKKNWIVKIIIWLTNVDKKSLNLIK